MKLLLSMFTVFFLFTNAGTGYAEKYIPVSMQQEINLSARVASRLLKEYKVSGESVLTPYIDEFSKMTFDVCHATASGDVYMGESGEAFALILEVLALSGDQRALPALIEMLSNPIIGSKSVDEGIAKIGRPAVDELMKLLNLEESSYVPAVIPLCLLKERDEKFITSTESTAIITKIRTHLDNDDELIKYVSVKALKSFGDSSDIPKLLELKEKTKTAPMSSTAMRNVMLIRIDETLAILQK